MAPPTITDIDVIACGLATEKDREWDRLIPWGRSREIDAKHVAKLNSISNDRVRTAYFQQIVRDIDVAEEMERGDWAAWLIHHHPNLVDEDMLTTESREDANHHTLNELIAKYEKEEAEMKKYQRLTQIAVELIKPAAGAPKEEWIAYARGLKTEYEKVIKLTLQME